MRQGETASKGHWQGSATGGVTAPDPILLPDPARRFLVTAERLERLADGHPMASWLAFMAALARAQHRAAETIALPTLDRAIVERAVAAEMPPIAADGHPRAPAWRDGLHAMLDALDRDVLPPPALALVEDLRNAAPELLETLANDFLLGSVAARDAGRMLFVVAALQVYFTRLTAALPRDALHLLPQRGLCPCCGSLPVAGLVMASGATPGTRYLHCSLCATAWNHVRAVCITCGGSRGLKLESIEGSSGAAVGETCPSCSSYAKIFYQSHDMQIDPYADDLASLGLDLLLAEEGWSRHAPNPLVLVR